MGKGHSFADPGQCGYSCQWRFLLELSEGPSHFAELKEDIFNMFNASAVADGASAHIPLETA